LAKSADSISSVSGRFGVFFMAAPQRLAVDILNLAVLKHSA
jgi:hypothetical protein